MKRKNSLLHLSTNLQFPMCFIIFCNPGFPSDVITAFLSEEIVLVFPVAQVYWFSFIKNIFISLSFLKNIFARYRILASFLSHFKDVVPLSSILHCFWCSVSHNLCLWSQYVKYDFIWIFWKVFFLILCSQTFDYDMVRHDLPCIYSS